MKRPRKSSHTHTSNTSIRDILKQSRAVGRVDEELITLAYEFVEDDFASLIKLITYWPASHLETRLYDQELGIS